MDISSNVGDTIRYANGGITAGWTTGYNPTSGNLIFSTGLYVAGSETTAVLALTQSSNVGIDTLTPSYTLHVNGSVAGTSAYNNLSDARLKKEVVKIADGLGIVSRLRGVHFQWRKPEERTIGKNLNLPIGEPQVGFIAQEVKSALPEAVTRSKDGVYSIEESKMAPVLVEAVKELKAIDDRQASEIAQLKKENGMLRVDQQARLGEFARRLGALETRLAGRTGKRAKVRLSASMQY
jgi:hypothetical protein